MIFAKTAGCCSVPCNLCTYQMSALENSRLNAWKYQRKKADGFGDITQLQCPALTYQCMLLSWVVKN